MVPEKPASKRPLSPEIEARLTQALLVACLAGTAYLFLQISMFRYGRDQGIYGMVADSILRGGMPYRDAWDFKPPGIFAAFALARAVFGASETSIRLLEVMGLASVVLAFALFAARFFGDFRAGIVAGALAVLVHGELEFWHTAQPESFGGMLTAWALVLATFEPRDGDPRARAKRLGAWALAGACYGAAFLMKPPLGAGALASSAFVTWRMSQRKAAIVPRDLALPTLVIGAGSAVPIALCVAWYAARGAFGDLYDAIFVFAPHYTKLSWEGASVLGALYLAFEEWFVDLSGPTAAGVLAALLFPPTSSREREGTLHILAVVALQLGGVAWQGKFFPYHYGASLLIGSLVAGLGAYKAWRFALARGYPAVATVLTIAYLVIQARSATRDTRTDFRDRCIARHRQLLGLSDVTRAELDATLYSVADVSYGANRKVADFLRHALRPDELAFIWGFEPIIYDMADRRPASRYIYNVPQRVAWAKESTRATLMADLDARPPKAIVVEHRDVFPVVTGDALDSADTLKKFPALAERINERYALVTTIEDFDVYILR
jgi:hypothetical protein